MALNQTVLLLTNLFQQLIVNLVHLNADLKVVGVVLLHMTEFGVKFFCKIKLSQHE